MDKSRLSPGQVIILIVFAVFCLFLVQLDLSQNKKDFATAREILEGKPVGLMRALVVHNRANSLAQIDFLRAGFTKEELSVLQDRTLFVFQLKK